MISNNNSFSGVFAPPSIGSSSSPPFRWWTVGLGISAVALSIIGIRAAARYFGAPQPPAPTSSKNIAQNPKVVSERSSSSAALDRVSIQDQSVFEPLYPDIPSDRVNLPPPFTTAPSDHVWLEDSCPKSLNPACLANNGNTCFLASIMHSFICNPKLTRALGRCIEILQNKEDFSNELEAFELLMLFLRDYEDARGSDQVIRQEMADLRRVLALLSPRSFFSGSTDQEDVGEVLGLLLSKMKDVFFEAGEELDWERKDLFSDVRMWTLTHVEPAQETLAAASALYPLDPAKRKQYVSLNKDPAIDAEYGLLWEGRGKDDLGLWNGNTVMLGIESEKKGAAECIFIEEDGTSIYAASAKDVIKEGFDYREAIRQYFFESFISPNEGGLDRKNQVGEIVKFEMKKKRRYLEYAPQVLNVYLNRFNKEQKISGVIEQIEEVLIAPGDYFLDKKPATYRLDCVILHFGEDKNSGHYKVILRNVDPEGIHYYFLCDDAACDGVYQRLIRQEDFLNLSREHGYVLFYTKID